MCGELMVVGAEAGYLIKCSPYVRGVDTRKKIDFFDKNNYGR